MGITLELFLSFFQVGLFSIGGGYAALPLINNQVVEINKWLTPEEFTDVITISQMTPGPIALNSATFVGVRVGGFWGSMAANFGCILPPFIIVFILANIYFKYRDLSTMQGILKWLRPTVVALIASAAVSLVRTAILINSSAGLLANNLEYINIILFFICFFILRKWKTDPIVVMLCSGVLGFAAYSLLG